MTRLRIPFLLALMLVPARAGAASLLAGLRSDSGAYRTLWILADTAGVRLAGEGEDILVPRANGFWRVGVARKTAGEWSEDYIQAALAGRAPSPAAPDPYDADECEGEKSLRILFAGRDWVSLVESAGGYCRGAAHPFEGHRLGVFSYEDLAGEPIPLARLAGGEAEAAFRRAGAAHHARLPSSRRYAVEEEPQAWNWGLVRRRGAWVLRGRLDYTAEVYRGSYSDFDIPVPPPRAWVGRADSADAWKAARRLARRLRDAFFSPAGDLLVLLDHAELRVHAVAGGRTHPAALRLPLRPGEVPVMIRWAEESEEPSWRREIPRLLRGPGNGMSAE